MIASHSTLQQRIRERLAFLFPDADGEDLYRRVMAVIDQYQIYLGRRQPYRHWNLQDVMLISYGDSIRTEGSLPLQTLNRFLNDYLIGVVSTVHLLPFFPYSSDDGFAVIDYLQVNPRLGSWNDVAEIDRNFDLMFDLVINHISSQHQWFQKFLQDEHPWRKYFICPPVDADLSQVVRPRATPLLTLVATAAGEQNVWTTFSADQVDVDFSNPEVLIEYLQILLSYLENGARFIRLDAIGFLWKEYGTSCINLAQTHEVVRLLRDVVDLAAPGTVLLTETNVPHQQNVSYFGDSDEAHMVYQFSLAPLLLHGLYRGTSQYLNDWARSSCLTPPGCTFLNFTASHDGIGMRPLEGLIPQGEVDLLLHGMEKFGGMISYRSRDDGSKSAYEINITYFDALKGTWLGEDSWQIARFLLAQTLMMALRGIPALYIHSLLATPNDHEGVEKSGRARMINRHSWDEEKLKTLLDDPNSTQAIVFNELRRRIKIRTAQPAFHPDARQELVHLGDSLFAFWRQSLDGKQRILAVHNLTDQLRTLYLGDALKGPLKGEWKGLLTGEEVVGDQGEICLPPYHLLWLTNVSAVHDS